MKKTMFSLALIFTFFTQCKNEKFLVEGLNSKEEVLETSFKALVNGEVKKLDSLLLTREEHNQIFWKYVGERFTSDPNMNADTAFDYMDFETQAMKKILLKEFAQMKTSILSSSCGKVEEYGPFRLHLGCKIVIESPKGTIPFDNIRSVLELNGKFKLYHLRR